MTFVATMRESNDSILIAADSGQMDATGLRTICPDKLKRHPSLNLAWGASGNATAGYLSFTNWMLSETPSTWEGLRRAAEDKLVELNHRQLTLSQSVGRANIDRDTAEVLLAGWIGNEAAILEIDHAGAGFYINMKYHSIGAGRLPIPIACNALEKLTSPPVSYEAFQAILDTAARSISPCNPPIHIWRITKDSIEILT